MRLLAIGDVCGSCGCEQIFKRLPQLKREKNIDTVIINCENSADGNGVTKDSAEYLFSCGADVLTGGNHSLRRSEVFDYLDSNDFILRPHNIEGAGKGYCLLDKGPYSIAVINLAGKIYLEKSNAQNPFTAVDSLIERARRDKASIIVVDFHAEATSEKRAMGFYLDGKASVVFGTHTHVLTADNQVLPKGTGYITDIGMTGARNSILGVKTNIIINRLRDNDMSKFLFEEDEGTLCGCIFEIDTKTGKTISTELVSL